MNSFPNNPKKILISNIFGIGDVLFTTPLISNLKNIFPNISISYLCNRRTAPILEGYSKIDKIFVYERDEFNKVYKRSKWEYFRKGKRLLNSIKQEDFDVVFDFSLNSTFDFLMWVAGIKERIGLNYKNRGRFLTKKFPFDGFEEHHVAECYINILQSLGLETEPLKLEMDVTEADRKWAEQFLVDSGLSLEKPLIGVLPGAGASWGKEARYRRWDVKNYAKLVDKIIENYQANIILMGDQSEAELCQQIRSTHQSAVIEAFGRTTVGQLAALMTQCKLVVLNDGGPLHMAVACGVKTVSIFGPVNEKVYGPYDVNGQHLVVKSDIICRPCYRRFRMTNCKHISCLRNISVNDVLEKVDQLL